MQETFVRVLAGRGPLRAPARGSVRGLVFDDRPAVAIDLCAARPSSRALGAESAPDLAADDVAGDRVLLSITIRDAMTSLMLARSRGAGARLTTDDLKLADIAARLDVPLGTVKTRAHDVARDALRAARARAGMAEHNELVALPVR